jgi:hypothetical protein
LLTNIPGLLWRVRDLVQARLACFAFGTNFRLGSDDRRQVEAIEAHVHRGRREADPRLSGCCAK